MTNNSIANANVFNDVAMPRQQGASVEYGKHPFALFIL
jgi:hypothetical protein